MSLVSVRVDQDGVRIPLADLADLGLTPGEVTQLRVSVESEAEAIRRNGMYYCWRKLGDALGVGLPVKRGDHWVSDLLMRDLPNPVGTLIYDLDGNVIAERSSSKQALSEAIDVARPSRSAE